MSREMIGVAKEGLLTYLTLTIHYRDINASTTVGDLGRGQVKKYS